MGLNQEKWMIEMVYEIMKLGVEQTTACELVYEWKEMIDAHLLEERKIMVEKACKMVKDYIKEVKDNG